MTTPRGPRRRAMIDAAARGPVLVALLVVLGFIGACGDPSGAGVDRADPSATAGQFLQLYAAHDPAACELISLELRSQFDGSGRCAGQPTGVQPQLDVLDSRTCGDRHSFSAAVDPPGEVSAPFVTVGLELVNGSWAVRSVLPLTDRSVIRPFECAAPATGHGG